MKKAIFYSFLLCSSIFLLKIHDFENFGFSVYHISVLLSLIYIIFAFLIRKNVKIKYKRYGYLYILLLIIILDFFFIGLYSKDLSRGIIRSIAQICHIVVFFMPFCFINSKRDFIKGLNIYLLVSFVLFIDRIIAIYNNYSNLIPGSSQYIFGFKSSFLFEDTNFVGGIAISLILLSLYKYKTTKSNKFIFLTFLNILNVILTFSKTACSVMVFASFLYFMFFIRKKETYFIIKRFYLFILLLVLLVIFIFPQIRDSLNIYLEEGQDTLFRRVHIWSAGVKLLADSPTSIIWGYGKDGFELYSAKYLGWSRGAHNMYLYLLMDGGVILLSLVILFFAFSIKLIPKGIERKFLIIGISSYFLYSIFVYSFNEPFILIFTSFLLIGGFFIAKDQEIAQIQGFRIGPSRRLDTPHHCFSF